MLPETLEFSPHLAASGSLSGCLYLLGLLLPAESIRIPAYVKRDISFARFYDSRHEGRSRIIDLLLRYARGCRARSQTPSDGLARIPSVCVFTIGES
ncbi:hypothetical protein EDB19DRAFT_402755 [Suillus lakei]|nr:hypothetical protein EDB19DRAFT_402755 [Suillus lakei]